MRRPATADAREGENREKMPRKRTDMLGWLHFYLGQKRNVNVHFRAMRTDDATVAALHAPGLIATSQLSNPRTQQVAPRARIA